MTTIFAIVEGALSTLSPAVPFAMDVFLTAAGELPDTYITYIDVSAVPAQHADNVETHRSFRIQLSIFSRSGLASLPNVDAAMLAAGFTLGPERQLPYDEGTHHFGLAKDYFYLQ